MKRVPSLLPLLGLLALAPTVQAQTPPGSPRPLSLVEALDLAERESEAVGIARQEIARAEGEQRRARSGYFPQLTGLASFQRALQSQFSALQGDGSTGGPSEECPDFVPHPGLPLDQRIDSLESALRCASTSNPFAGLGQRPAVRAGEHLPLRPFVLPDPLRRRAGLGPGARGGCRCPQRDGRAHLRAGRSSCSK